MIDKLSF